MSLTLKVVSTGSKGNCYLLNCDGKTLILDAGIPVKEIKKALNFNIKDVSLCFCSHGHSDHVKAVEDLRLMGVRIFEPYKSGKPSLSYSVDGWHLYSFSVPHDGAENRAVYIVCPNGYRLLYATDFEYLPVTLKKQKLNGMLIECNYTWIDDDEAKTEHVLRGHASLDVTKGIVKANKTESLNHVILCHLSEWNADEGKIMLEITDAVDIETDVLIARKGLEVLLKDG